MPDEPCTVTRPEPSRHVEEVARLEVELLAARKRAGKALKLARPQPVRAVAKRVRCSAATVTNTENARTWSTKTARKLARYYESLAGRKEAA